MASIVKFHMRSRRQNEFQKEKKEIHIVLLQFFSPATFFRYISKLPNKNAMKILPTYFCFCPS